MPHEDEDEYGDNTQVAQASAPDPQGASEADRYGNNQELSGGGGGGGGGAPGIGMEQLAAILGSANLGDDGGSGGGGSGGSGSSGLANSLAAVYVELWGHNPPPGVIEAAVSAGLNPIQYREQIMADPSWRKSPVYKEMKRGRMMELLKLIGARP